MSIKSSCDRVGDTYLCQFKMLQKVHIRPGRRAASNVCIESPKKTVLDLNAASRVSRSNSVPNHTSVPPSPPPPHWIERKRVMTSVRIYVEVSSR